MRPGGCFGVILHSKDVLSDISEPLVRAVVDVHKSLFCHAFIEAGRIHGISVVLRCYIDPAGLEILDRMIASAVPVFEFICIAARCESH